MRYRWLVIIPVVVLPLLLAGCYTQFYRPDMEQNGQGPYGSLYNRYDSTAIDTTLRKPDDTGEYPPPTETDNGWYDWGRPRTRWGFDFDNFDPSYYWSYYGYYDYYSRPWWSSYYDPYYGGWYPGYYGGGNGVPGEPPSKRPAPRNRGESGTGYGQPANTAPAQGAPNISTAPPASSGGAAQPQTPPSNGGETKRSGGRGR